MLNIEHEEYVDKTTEFQLLRVTKDLQELIKVGGYDEKQKSEVAQLEKKIQYIQDVCAFMFWIVFSSYRIYFRILSSAFLIESVKCQNSRRKFKIYVWRIFV
jgi:hypothetical protein